ncbi:Biopolymer transport protein ExbD/TolR [Pseudobythopirellula maris]|uniref:Biopolymer transport protein ExbD/TolR n=1 Tax=Pseudobythopirellula maris TaxID=2527991 RepID=A0A5C5ZR93_9BACT|nr:biopolymer transporter ExbD [Pseudobythopirellula maris]TWT90019.1 Biopolymer transport protein ExbD/TolR [Pseudobythopirellula maris]
MSSTPPLYTDPDIDHAEGDLPASWSRRLREGSAEDEVDMTPMVDVTFLLLIFFMITAAFALQKALEVPPQQEQEEAASMTIEELEADSIVVRVDGDNVFWIGSPSWSEERRAPSKQEMRVKLREAREGLSSSAGPPKMLVQANGDAAHEYVVAALDAGSSVGVEEIQLLSYEDGDL